MNTQSQTINETVIQQRITAKAKTTAKAKAEDPGYIVRYEDAGMIREIPVRFQSLAAASFRAIAHHRKYGRKIWAFNAAHPARTLFRLDPPAAGGDAR